MNAGNSMLFLCLLAGHCARCCGCEVIGDGTALSSPQGDLLGCPLGKSTASTASKEKHSMTQAKAGDTVRIHYSGTLADGTQFDTSEGSEPLEFALGSGSVIPGFDQAVEGMSVGENKSVSIGPEQAYGPRHDQLVQEVPRQALPDDIDPTVGMRLQGQGPDGQMMNLTVTRVEDEAITVDANHPLAGEVLNFDIELVAIV
jgi:peptidylprolyl isomerase